MARKHLRTDKKKRAPGKQPICGLWAAARCVGRHLRTAAEVDAFRQECLARGLLHRGGSWVGGTTSDERARIVEGFGGRVQAHPAPASTVARLLTHPSFFKTRGQWLLVVRGHCVYVHSNTSKRKLYCMDQRGTKMRLPQKQAPSCAAMQKLLRQRVVSISAVHPPVASQAPEPP